MKTESYIQLTRQGINGILNNITTNGMQRYLPLTLHRSKKAKIVA